MTSDLNVLSTRGTPTAHIALNAERPFGGEGPLSLTIRAAWPLLGAQFTDEEGRFIRTWTFAAETGLRMRLRDRSADLRPVIGAAVGLRSALSDTGEFELRASRISMTPALSLAVNAGLRYRVRPLVDLVLETDLSQGLLLLTDRRPYEKAAARERLLRLSLGVLFEY